MRKVLSKVLSFVLTLAVAMCFIGAGTSQASASTKVGMDDSLWVGVEAYLSETYYFKEEGNKVTSVTSSAPAVLKVNRQGKKTDIESYWFMPKKPGKATITIKYKTKKGKTASQKITRTVKKMPAVFKSLKVNGKSVNLSTNKTVYSIKYTKTSPSVQLELKGDWQIIEKSCYLTKYDKKGNWLKDKQVKLTRKMLKNGTSFSYPKTWDDCGINLVLENDNGELFRYWIDLYRR